MDFQIIIDRTIPLNLFLEQSPIIRTLNLENKHPKVLTYINIRLTMLCFSLIKDRFNHKDINLISFFNNESIYFVINVYSDDH